MLATMSLTLQFLGTGTSAGVPMIGCPCPVCGSDDPRDRRDRCSVLLTWDDPKLKIDDAHLALNPAQRRRRQLLIDASPDLRWQARRAGLSRLDAVLLTHAHVDHVFGLDDLRRFNAAMDASLPVYAERRVHDQLGRAFEHIFAPPRGGPRGFVARLDPLLAEPGRTIDFWGARVSPVRLHHGRLPIVGYRIDHGGVAAAYCTDVSRVPPESYPGLRGLDLLVIDALRPRHHPTHLSTDQALEIIDELAPRRALLTHLAHDEAHADLAARLPPGVAPAYDGLSVELPVRA